MATYSVNKFLEYFLQNKLIDQKTFETIQVDILKSDITAEEYVARKRIANDMQIMMAKAYAMGVDYIDLQSTAASPEALGMIPEVISREFDIFPFEYDQKSELIKIASEDPLNLESISFLEKKTGKKILPYLASKSDINDAIRLQYRQSISPTVANALEEYSSKDKEKEYRTIKSDESSVVKEPPIARLVNTILEYAVKGRASDIHIEPQELKTRVRYRIDGILYEKLSLPKSLQDSLISRIKILSQMRIDERRIPQDGRFTFKIGEQEIDLRVSSLPTVHGEKIVMRLLKKTGGIPSLPDLGLGGVTLKNLETAMTRPYGIILITGPTGSGKTTTLYSILQQLNKPSVNIMTLEDPVEYEIPGLNQVQIHPQAGLTFASGLRSFLRQDPNIILVGEIRDRETTGLAIQAALTGHLVFSTLHTNDAATAIPRLIDLGAEPFLIASVLAGVAGQRIIRRVCDSCKATYNPSPEIEKSIRDTLGDLLPVEFKTKQLALYKGKGCEECGSSGYFGRIGIYELIPVIQEISHLILKSATAAEIEKEARKYGLITMKQDGYLKALAGVTTIEEVMRVAEE